jgi:hypothetical protein
MAANLADRREAKNPPPPNGTINNINEIGIAHPERKAGLGCFSGVFRARLYTAAFAPAGALQWPSANGRIQPSVKAIIASRTAKCVLIDHAALPRRRFR